MEQNVTKVMIVVVNLPLKEEKEGGEDWLKELLSSMLELLGKTGKAEASLLHHLAPAKKNSSFRTNFFSSPAGTMSISEENTCERGFEHLRSWTHDTRGRCKWRREDGKSWGLRRLHQNLADVPQIIKTMESFLCLLF